MKSRIYVDASIVGGCEDDEFSEHSSRLMRCFARGDFVLVVSTLTIQELADAPDEVRRHIVNLYRIHGYNSVNLRRGYPTLEIRAPREVLADE